MIADTVRRVAWQIAGVYLASGTIQGIASLLVVAILWANPPMSRVGDYPVIVFTTAVTVVASAAMSMICFYMGRRIQANEVAEDGIINWNPVQQIAISMIGLFLIVRNVPYLSDVIRIALIFVRGRESHSADYSYFVNVATPLAGIAVGLWLFFDTKRVARIQSWALQRVESDEVD